VARRGNSRRGVRRRRIRLLEAADVADDEEEQQHGEPLERLRSRTCFFVFVAFGGYDLRLTVRKFAFHSFLQLTAVSRFIFAVGVLNF
jgi:hypothetical protein